MDQLDTFTLRQMIHDALSLTSQVDMFKTQMDQSADDVKYAYTILYQTHCEKLQKKIDELAHYMGSKNLRTVSFIPGNFSPATINGNFHS